jgi:SAM-dependent methyltransferase
MVHQGSLSSFPDVDRSANPASLVHYLTAVSSLEAVKEYKQATYDLLNPQEAEHILDVGCGAGDDALILAQKLGPKGRMVGVDHSRVMVREAQKRAVRLETVLEFHQGNATELPFRDLTFDACRIDRVLQHIDSPIEAIKEMARVIKIDGRIVASEPDWDTVTIDAPDRGLARKIIHYHCDSVRHGWIGRHLPALFRAAGLEKLTVKTHTLTLTDIILSDQVLGIRTAAQNAAAAGVISANEAATWQAHLATAAQEGNFLCSLTGFIVRAYKRAG